MFRDNHSIGPSALIEWERMKTALIALNVSYIHKNLALRWLWVTKPAQLEAHIFEGLTKSPLALLEDLIAYKPDVIAFSVYIFNLEATLTIIKALREHLPEALIVAGGPEATYNPKPLFEVGVDRIYRGEAELVFWEDLQGQKVQGVQHSPTETVDVLRADLAVLETLESPYFLEMDAFAMDHRYLYVESSRGCPFGCAYCLAAQDPHVRLFSDQYMEEFFAQVSQTTVRQIKFLDRTFNLDPQRALRLAQMCLNLPQDIKVHVELVGDRLSEALIVLFTEHPERFRLELGVQSLNQQTLKAVGRHSDLHKLLNVVDRFAQARLIQHTDLIAGLPHENLSSFINAYNGLIRLDPYELQVGILKILHGSAMDKYRLSSGYHVDPNPPYQVRQTPWMSKNDFQAVEAVAVATEKAYNSQKLRDELHLAFEVADPFACMMSIGHHLLKLSRPYTNQAFHLAIYAGLSEHLPQERAKALVLHAYLRHATILPPRLFPDSIDKATLNAVRKLINADDSIKHIVISPRLDDQVGVLAWCFGSHPHKPIPIVVNEWPITPKEPR